MCICVFPGVWPGVGWRGLGVRDVILPELSFQHSSGQRPTFTHKSGDSQTPLSSSSPQPFPTQLIVKPLRGMSLKRCEIFIRGEYLQSTFGTSGFM